MKISQNHGREWQLLRASNIEGYTFPAHISIAELGNKEVQGLKLLAEGKLDEAEIKFHSFFTINPSRAETWAVEFYQMGQSWMAIRAFVAAGKYKSKNRHNTRRAPVDFQSSGYKDYAHAYSLCHYNLLYDAIDVNALHVKWKPYDGLLKSDEVWARLSIIEYVEKNIHADPETTTSLLKFMIKTSPNDTFTSIQNSEKISSVLAQADNMLSGNGAARKNILDIQHHLNQTEVRMRTKSLLFSLASIKTLF